MSKYAAKQPLARKTSREWRRVDRCGPRGTWCAVAAAAMLIGPATVPGQQPPTTPVEAVAESQEPATRDGTLTMTEKDFEAFLAQRSRFRDLLWFRNAKPIGDKTQEQLRAMQEEQQKARRPYMLFVQLPDRLVGFFGIKITVDLDAPNAGLPRLEEAFPHFPEITGLCFRHGSGQSRLRTLLEKSRELPNLFRMTFRQGGLSRDDVAALATNARARRLELAGCLVTTDSFMELANMKSLEELAVDGETALTPECFLTLAKLPKFRSFHLNNPTAFDVPIHEDTRLAIESLNGRLEVFSAREMPTRVHASFVRALFQVRSLKTLELDVVGPGLTLKDVEQLENLTDLSEFECHLPRVNPSMSAEDQVKARAIIEKAYARANETRRKQSAAGR